MLRLVFGLHQSQKSTLRHRDCWLTAKPRMDNGPECIALALADQAEQHHAGLEFIEPGRPVQNGFIERFNRSYREGVLSIEIFRTLQEGPGRKDAWMQDYNEALPHDALGELSSGEYKV